MAGPFDMQRVWEAQCRTHVQGGFTSALCDSCWANLVSDARSKAARSEFAALCGRPKSLEPPEPRALLGRSELLGSEGAITSPGSERSKDLTLDGAVPREVKIHRSSIERVLATLGIRAAMEQEIACVVPGHEGRAKVVCAGEETEPRYQSWNDWD